MPQVLGAPAAETQTGSCPHRPRTITISAALGQYQDTCPPSFPVPQQGRAGPGSRLVLLSCCVLLSTGRNWCRSRGINQKFKVSEDFCSEFEQPALALRAPTTSFWASGHGRLFSGSGAVPGPGLTPGTNYILLHQACIDRVNSRVAQKGNL